MFFYNLYQIISYDISTTGDCEVIIFFSFFFNEAFTFVRILHEFRKFCIS